MRRTHRITIVLSEEEYKNLEALKTRQMISQGSCIRRCLAVAASSCLEGKMLCGTGARCLVPHIRDEQGPQEIVGPGHILVPGLDSGA